MLRKIKIGFKPNDYIWLWVYKEPTCLQNQFKTKKQKEDRLTRRPSTFREACFPRKYNMIEWTGKTRNRRTESLDGFTLE